MSDSDSSEDEQTKREVKFREYLRGVQQRSAFEKTSCDFIPEGVLSKIVTDETIRDLLDIKGRTPEDEQLIQFVKIRAPKVLAIAVCAKTRNLKDLMIRLKGRNFDDNHLPIINPDNAFRKKGWYNDLIEHQWKFYAATFSTTKYSHDLEESRVLPFTSKAGDGGRGSFGVVSRYIIHRNHMEPVSGSFSRKSPYGTR
jgi:hypothetical protein